MSTAESASVTSTLNAWYRANARDFAWRRPGTSPWAVLIIEFMARQTQIERAGEAWAVWLERWPTPADLAAAPPAEAIKAWGRLGYPRRALALHATATEIAEHHGGEVPSSVEELLALPGIGPYTAAAVAAFAYGVRTPVVDTNIRRVLARAVNGQAEAWPPSARRDAVEMAAMLPEDPAEARVANVAFMELGALVCTARSPKCESCPIADACAWRAAGYPAHEGPRRAPAARFHGSDRQVRGRVMAELRAADRPVSRAELMPASDDPAQLDRAIAGLVRDGLAIAAADGLALPGS